MPEDPSNVHRMGIPPREPPASAPHRKGAGLSTARLTLAFLIAAISDGVSYGTAWTPPIQLAVDLVTALFLFVLLGWRWALLPGLIAEAIPGLAVFPVWLLVVTAVAIWGRLK